MPFVEFTPMEMGMIARILNKIKKETGVRLDAADPDFLLHLDHAMKRMGHQATITTYENFLREFSDPAMLKSLGIKIPPSNQDLEEIAPKPKRAMAPAHAKLLEEVQAQKKEAPKRSVRIYRGRVIED